MLELKVPPLVLLLIVGGLMWLAAWVVPAATVDLPGRWPLAAVLTVAGLVLASCGVAAFRRARTTVDPTRPDAASAIVSSGVYRISRNPMYVGFLLALAGWAAWLANIVALAGLPLFVAYMNRFQIRPEERALRARFGATYDVYRRSVRRWL